MDKLNRTARADGGALQGDVDYDTQFYGLAVFAGIVSHRGIGGLALGVVVSAGSAASTTSPSTP